MTSKPQSIYDLHPDAWAEMVKDVLHGQSVERRIEILKIALADLQREAAEDENWYRDNPGDLLRWHEVGEIEDYLKSPHNMQWNRTMRIEATIAYSLIRHVTNNNSPENARKLLLSRHDDGPGSGYLEEYLDGILPRPKRKVRQEA